MEQIIILNATIGIMQVFKVAGFPARFIPLAAILVGAAMTLSTTPITGDYTSVGWLVVNGMVAGLGAVGLYSGAKNTAQGSSSADTTLKKK